MKTSDTLQTKIEKAKAAQTINAKHPTDTIIDLSGPEGNIFYIMCVCYELGLKQGLPSDELLEYYKACQNKSYREILKLSQEWFGLIYIND